MKPNFKNVGMVCSEFRKNKLNISMTGLGREIGTSQQYISAFEKGKANSLYLLMAYISLGVDIDDLIGGFTKDYENIRNTESN